MPILTALAKIGNQEHVLRFGDNRTACRTAFVSVASHYQFELFFIYLHFSIVTRHFFVW